MEATAPKRISQEDHVVDCGAPPKPGERIIHFGIGGGMMAGQAVGPAPQSGQPAMPTVPTTVYPSPKSERCIAVSEESQSALKLRTPPALSSQVDKAVLMTLLFKKVCDVQVPGFQQRSAAAYSAWASKHAAAIAEAERTPDFQSEIRRIRESGKAPKGDPQQLQSLCSDQFIASLDAQSRPPDSRFASPQITWQTFIGALRRADRATAAATFDPGTQKSTMESLFGHMTDEQLVDMANSFTAFALGQSYGDFTEAYVTRTGGKAGIITFINEFGEWKIQQM